MDPAFNLERSWTTFANPDATVAAAKAFLVLVRDGEVEPLSRLDELEAAVEPLWDGPGGDPRLVRVVLERVEVVYRNAESFLPLTTEEHLVHRLRPQLLLARASHRCGRPRQAFASCLEALEDVENFVGGRAALLDVLGRRTPNVVAEHAIGFLGLYPAAVRRAELRHNTGAYLDNGRKMVEAYVGIEHPGEPPLYRRTHAVASQWFYEGVRTGDEQLVRALYELDLRSRPHHPRAQATALLRDFELARRFEPGSKDLDELRQRAWEALVNNPLPRHAEEVARRRYLD